MMKHIILEQYQAKLDQLPDLKGIVRPREGWIRTFRKALGMSASQLASRVGIGKAQASQMERMETEDRITLKQLRRVAEALDCELYYALVPRQPIADYLHQQARKKAKMLVDKAHIQMVLEDQQLPAVRLQKQIDAETERLLREMPRELWNE